MYFPEVEKSSLQVGEGAGSYYEWQSQHLNSRLWLQRRSDQAEKKILSDGMKGSRKACDEIPTLQLPGLLGVVRRKIRYILYGSWRAFCCVGLRNRLNQAQVGWMDGQVAVKRAVALNMEKVNCSVQRKPRAQRLRKPALDGTCRCFGWAQSLPWWSDQKNSQLWWNIYSSSS